MAQKSTPTDCDSTGVIIEAEVCPQGGTAVAASVSNTIAEANCTV